MAFSRPSGANERSHEQYRSTAVQAAPTARWRWLHLRAEALDHFVDAPPMAMAPSNPKYQAQITGNDRLRQDKKAGSGDGRGKMVRRFTACPGEERSPQCAS